MCRMIRYVVSRLVVAVAMVLLATLVIFLIANTVPGDPVLTQLGDMAASNPVQVAAFRAQVGPRPAAVGSLLAVPRAAGAWRSRRLDLLAPAGAAGHRRLRPRHPRARDGRLPAVPRWSACRSACWRRCGATPGSTMSPARSRWSASRRRPSGWPSSCWRCSTAGWTGRRDRDGSMPVSFPPDRITGFLLIDTALAGDWDTFHDAAAHLVLPSIVLAAATLGLITRTTRAAMLEALSQDYVRVAQAKGLRGAADRARPCLAQRPAAGGDAGRPRLRQPAGRRGADRDRVLLARPRPLHVPQRGDARLPGHHGHHRHRRGDLRVW